MKKTATQRIVLIALYTALAIALDYFKEMLPFLNMPQGGSVNIATIPVVLAAFHLGALDGILTGIIWWLITTFMGLNYPPISFMEALLDYVVPSGILGIASLFWRGNKEIWKAEAGILLANLIRIASILIAGAYYWFPDGEAAGSAAAWANSLAYNLPYLLATAVMLLIVIPLLLSRFRKQFA